MVYARLFQPVAYRVHYPIREQPEEQVGVRVLVRLVEDGAQVESSIDPFLPRKLVKKIFKGQSWVNNTINLK